MLTELDVLAIVSDRLTHYGSGIKVDLIGPVDEDYLRKWAPVLGVESALEDMLR